MDSRIVKDLPKVELHCHLDGSVSVRRLKELILSSGDELPENWHTCVHAPQICNNLEEYLKPFPLIVKYLQTEKALELAAYDVIAQAAAENVIYIEMRFAPILHCQGGLDCDGVVKAVLSGVKRAEQDFSVKAGVILCLMRGGSDDDNKRVIDAACYFYDNGVAAVDLAGNEAKYPTGKYAGLFELAAAKGLPFTIHAGENGPSENVLTAIEMGASRIGHGLALSDSPKLRKLCAEKNILLELCPASNLQTKAAKSLRDYPINLFLRDGIPVSVNTDNRTVSNTDLTREFMLLSSLGIDYKLMKIITLKSVEHAFLRETEKRELAKIIDDAYLSCL